MIRKIVGWGLVAFALFYLTTDPHGAANFAHSLAGGLRSLAQSAATFVNSL